MPCSLCGGIGHNRRTCKMNIAVAPVQGPPVQEPPVQEPPVQEPPKQEFDIEDPILTMILSEKYIRELLISGKISELKEEKIKFFEEILSIKKKEFKLINLDSEISYDIYISNENSNVFTTENKEYSYMGTIYPRSLDKLITFTGYKYLFKFQYQSLLNHEELIIEDNIKDTYTLNEYYEKDNDKRFPLYPSFKLNEKNQALISSLKMNYLLNEMKRLGGLEDDNYGCILDMHEDILIPDHNDLDLEAAGLPNKLFTNVS